MEIIEEKIEQIKELINNVSDGFDNLSFESFDNSFPVIVSEMKQVHVLRNELLNEFGLENLLKYEPYLLQRSKQIQNKFDNLLEIFTQEEKKLEKELASYSGKKKIANYLRY